jgi:hypothetical protein
MPSRIGRSRAGRTTARTEPFEGLGSPLILIVGEPGSLVGASHSHRDKCLDRVRLLLVAPAAYRKIFLASLARHAGSTARRALSEFHLFLGSENES